MKKLTHILITLTFAFSCFGLWAVLNVFGTISSQGGQGLPAFTTLLIGMREWLLILPIPVAFYCGYALFRPQLVEPTGITFLACAMSTFCLAFFPVLLGVFLPCVVLVERALTK